MTEPTHVPPQNLDAEESVLGAMMLSRSAITAVAEEVGPGDFYRDSHGVIFKVALDLDARGEPVDAITLSDELESRRTPDGKRSLLELVGGKSRLAEIAALTPASSNAAHYARIVKEHATLRGLIRAGGEISRLGWERPGETAELVEQAERLLSGVASGTLNGEPEGLGSTLDELYSTIAHAVESNTPIHGLMTGFYDFDHLTTGLYGGQLAILAARPKVGKSTLAQNICENVADQGVPVAVFSYEMSKRELGLRSVVRATGLDLTRLRTGRLNEQELAVFREALKGVKQRPVFVEANPGLTMPQLRARARRLKAKHDVGLFVVDYLQLMLTGTSNESRQVEVAQISRNLKLLAAELDVPVLALSQLSRKLEAREDKRPMLSDLRDSGAIEQDADLVMFLYRESLYREVGPEKANDTELNIAGSRMTAPGSCTLIFQPRRSQFANLAKHPQNGDHT